MKVTSLLYFQISILFKICFVNYANGGALILNSGNFDKTIGNNELVFINFYADWCRFSNILAPVWDEFEEKFKKEFPSASNVVIGKVDAHTESEIASRYKITKYPTIKLIRYGQPIKKEYRGQRTSDAFLQFIKEEMRDPIENITSLDQLKTLPGGNKRMVIGYFDDSSTPEYAVFQRVAKQLKSDCKFYAGFGDVVRSMHPPKESIVVFRSSIDGEEEVAKDVNLRVFDELSIWASERCIPMVREITFDNAEELTEEGLPFLVLFHELNDTDTLSRFIKAVQAELRDMKQEINILHADGRMFSHPLSHLGLSINDLPQIVIDSFRHMYVFPGGVKNLEVFGKLRKFVTDLHSGKLHREFHYGPDPAEEEKDDQGVEKDSETPPTTPPESQFKRLLPSENRYTFKDEF